MRKEPGIAIVVVMMSLGLLAVAVMAITYLANRSLMQTKLQGETDEAFFAAQAALNLKVAELRSGDETSKQGTMTDSDAHYQVKVYMGSDTVDELPGFIVPVDHYYIVARGFDRDPAGLGQRPREVKFGALFQRGATAFMAAALAGELLSFKSGSFTDTWDSSTGAAGDHSLAHVGVYLPGGSVNIESGSSVGYDGANALADILVPAGFTGSITGTAGSEFAAQTVSPFLTAPDPVTPRTAGSSDFVVSSTPATPTLPVLVAGEYVFKAKDFKIENGATFTLDVSSVPDGKTVYLDVNEFNMDGGVFQIFDSDATSYGSGTASEVSVQVYAVSKFDVSNSGQFGTINDEPKRMVAYCEGDMRLVDMATSYMIGRSKTKVEVRGTSELYGSVLSDSEVLVESGSMIHYDEKLQDQGTGATGAGTLQFLSFQAL